MEIDIKPGSHIGGTLPSPTPRSKCFAFLTAWPASTWHPAGSTAPHMTLGLAIRKARATPRNGPPVPTQAGQPSVLPQTASSSYRAVTEGCPSAAHTTARPAPMLPLVISTTGALGLRRLGTRCLDDGASRRDPSRTPPWLIFGRAHPRCGIAPPLV